MGGLRELASPMDTRIALLRKIAATDPPLLRPQPSLASFCGYSYEGVRESLGGDPGDEIEHLEHLADLGLLDRQFFDKVHLCPACSSFTLNFREVCPRCASADVSITEMIHHYKCGFVGPESEFRDGVRYECPKCARPLRHIGLDYERPAATYLCHACRDILTEPKVNCLCLKCGNTAGVDKATVRTVHVYRLSARGALAASRGTMDEAAASGAFVDSSLGIYTYPFFEERLAQETPRAKRHQIPLCVMLVRPDKLEEYERAHGLEARATLLKDIARMVRESLRGSDVPALHGEDTFALLLTDTRLDQSYAVAERLRKRAEGLAQGNGKAPVTISIGVAEYSEALETPRRLIEAAGLRLVEARGDGGDCVRPPAS